MRFGKWIGRIISRPASKGRLSEDREEARLEVLTHGRRGMLSWNQLIEAFSAEGWRVVDNAGGITSETEGAEKRTTVRHFTRDAPRGCQACQFWQDDQAGLCELAQSSLDQIRASFQRGFWEKQAAGSISTLEALRTSLQQQRAARRVSVGRDASRRDHAIARHLACILTTKGGR